MRAELLVFVNSPATAVMQALAARFTCHHVWQVPATEKAAFIDAVAGRIQGVLTVASLGVDAGLIARLPRLEIVSLISVGYDSIDRQALAARGIALTNTPGVLTDAVADLATLLVLATSRRLIPADRHIRSGAWRIDQSFPLTRGVRGKTAGIYGYGRIGQAVAARLRAFGMAIRYYQPRPVSQADAPRDASLTALAANSDYLILCAPATEATRGAVDAGVMRALGPDGTLINIARGSLVDEAALVACLDSGELGAAGLDVFADEPAVPRALWSMDQVVLTPHIGSATMETREAMAQLALDNLQAHFDGVALPSAVPPPLQ